MYVLWNWNRFTAFGFLFFTTLDGFLRWSEVPLLTYRQKLVFACFETGFMAFSVLLLALWRFFCVDHRYRCQDTAINVCSPVLKPVLRYFSFYFLYFRGIFASIGGTFSKIREKTFVCRLWNRFYGIRRSFFFHFGALFALFGGTVDKKRALMCVRLLWNLFYGILRFFLALCRFFCVVRKYRCQIPSKTCSPTIKSVLRHSPFN